MSYAIGIDIGGTNIKAVCVKPSGEVFMETSITTDDEPDAGWPNRIKQQVEHIQSIQSTRHGDADWIGVASPGLAAPDGSTITWMQGRMEAVQGLNWTALFNFHRPVPVLNDAHAALLGEVWLGAAAGSRNAALFTLGTGVGGAVLVDGHLLKGHIGRAGHLGHICLDVDAAPDIVNTPGSLEDAIGECSINTRGRGVYTSTRALVDAHNTGDEEASSVWLRSIWQLACGIVSVVNVTDPECVIIGGGIAKASDNLFGPLRKFVDRIEWRPTGSGVRIVPAELGEFAGALGAARNAMAADQESNVSN